METGDIKKVKVDDIEVAYKRFGEGEPLVMVMGLSGTLDLWEPRVLEALSSAYEVIIFDYRGMGETSTGSSEFSIERFADDTVGLMGALDIDRAHLLGWSMGGDGSSRWRLPTPRRWTRSWCTRAIAAARRG